MTITITPTNETFVMDGVPVRLWTGIMTSQLFLRIPVETKRGTRLDYYYLFRMPDSESVRVAWRLTKDIDGKESHVVTAYKNGIVECSCEDFNYRRRQSRDVCKHVASLREQRLLPK